MAVSSVDGFPQDLSPDSYTVEREVGRGGMATVYVVRDVKHGRRVALKVLRPELAVSLGAERFRREIALAASLQHPHIVSVYDSGQTPSGALWFTMPLVEGESLRDRLRRQHQLSVDDAVRITREVALALDYAHRQGVIHRDIKPENILLADGQAMVADFGVARALAEPLPGETLTATGIAVGTPAYMSPEQAAGERALDPATDIYSLGAVCYEMLTGEPPFPGPTAQAIAAKMRSGEVPSIRRVRPSVPEAIEGVVRKALAPVPADRYATAGEFAKALETADRTAFASGSRSAARAGWPKLPLVATALGLAAIIALVLVVRTRQVRASATGPVRIAVLPFDNLGDTSEAYFADGVTDAVRGKLTAVPGLEVTAPVSSGEYRRTSKTPQQIGRELGVRYLLIGRVRWAKGAAGGSRVQVNPALIDASTAADKWEAPFDSPLTDVFQVQADIATRVAHELQVALTPTTEANITRQPTRNTEAYDDFLRGQALEAAQLGDSRAMAAYARAVQLDSNYAEAWAALAHADLFAALTDLPQSAVLTEQARVAAQRALSLAPDLADARAAQGLYYALAVGDRRQALAEFQAGLRLSPGNGALLRDAAIWEWYDGQYDSALAHSQRAAQLDPRNADAVVGLCDAYRGFGRYADAAHMCDAAMALQPTNVLLVQHRVFVSLEQGDLPGARAVIHNALATADSVAVAATFAENDELGWVLDSTLERVLLRQPRWPEHPDDRASWMCALAQQYGYRGDSARARAYADSAAAAYAITLRTFAKGGGKPPPSSLANLQMFYGLSLAYLGRRDSALAQAKAALGTFTGAYQTSGPYFTFQLVKVYLLLNQPDEALATLAPLVTTFQLRVEQASSVPVFTPGYLRLDPNLARLRQQPRFEELLARPVAGAP